MTTAFNTRVEILGLRANFPSMSDTEIALRTCTTKDVVYHTIRSIEDAGIKLTSTYAETQGSIQASQ